MRIAVLIAPAPFASGGAEAFARTLAAELESSGHDADVVGAPFDDRDRRSLLGSCLAWRALALDEVRRGPIDAVVATSFPTHLVSHPRKVAWLRRSYRSLYEHAGTPFARLFPDRFPDAALRDLLVELDRRALAECRARFATSRAVAERLARFHGLAAEPILHPPPLAGRLAAVGWDGPILAVGRLEPEKRIDLLLDALARSKSGARCVVAGEGAHERDLRSFAERLALGARVEFLGRVSDERLARLYGECRAVYFAPYEADDAAPALEAFLSGKAVVTAADSGAALELVEDGVTGLVAEPDGDAVAAAIDRLAGDESLARRLGEAGERRAQSISWRGAVARILESIAPGEP